MESQAVESDACSKFKSPLRILVRCFRRSRDKWKRKYLELRTEIKRYKNQAGDARRSRAEWKKKAQAFEARARQLESELDRRWQEEKKRSACGGIAAQAD